MDTFYALGDLPPEVVGGTTRGIQGGHSSSTSNDPAAPISPAQRRCCDEFAGRCFPAAAAVSRGHGEGGIRPAPVQGFCSYTLLVGDDTVLQFRPAQHRPNLELCELARAVYGELVPRITFVGTVVSGESSQENAAPDDLLLYAYALSLVPGVSLSAFRCGNLSGQASSSPSWATASTRMERGDAAGQRYGHEELVRDLARFYARGWHAASASAGPAPHRVGRIGSSLRWRLDLLRDGLPRRFQPFVERVLADLPTIERALPWVLTHGDVVPGNIMVSATDVNGHPRLAGLLDWAEAEHLPFGVGMYGLEELLGESSPPKSHGDHAHYPAPGTSFSYYRDEPTLRAAFWAELETAIPAVRRVAAGREKQQQRSLRAVVESARLLGILLWHGIAFDGGRLDRVVRQGDGGVDDAEIQRLDLFLLRWNNKDASGDPESVPHYPNRDILDPDEAMMVEILDEDDDGDNDEQSPYPRDPQQSRKDPGPDRSDMPRRRQSFGDAARRAWDYMRRLPFRGKL